MQSNLIQVKGLNEEDYVQSNLIQVKGLNEEDYVQSNLIQVKGLNEEDVRAIKLDTSEGFKGGRCTCNQT